MNLLKTFSSLEYSAIFVCLHFPSLNKWRIAKTVMLENGELVLYPAPLQNLQSVFGESKVKARTEPDGRELVEITFPDSIKAIDFEVFSPVTPMFFCKSQIDRIQFLPEH